jgi:TRAP-type C4-dicarboxylate transport system substrate-binding protein
VSDITLRVGGYAPQDATHSSALETFADVVRRESGGRIAVDVMCNVMDEGRPATDLLDMTERGDLALCYFSTSYLGSRVPALNVLETPFLFDDLDGAHDALDGALGDALTAEVESATGFRVLGYWDNGFRHMTNRVHPIRTPEDCRGLRVRLQPNALHEAMIEAWGGIPVGVELSEGVAMIADGRVDAQENPLANTVAYGVDRVHRFATMTAHLYGARGVFAHPCTLASLSDEDRTLFETAARRAIDVQRSIAAEREVTLRTRLEAGGMEFVDLTESERDAFRQAADQVIERARRDVGDELFELASRR